ncbi:EamA-like transporter family [Seminavis robusta]|uniref:EamA-like transporter family n=1 Tax=Seminavis robusta TaxID=568900 RepID=A0A9N8EHY8_9STRA|nr:EamA-like transporter family [Seminavis robusta]|eukprot:Sro965_g225560.1 EamA-like transporter family (485) ;mRNA; r:10376-11911
MSRSSDNQKGSERSPMLGGEIGRGLTAEDYESHANHEASAPGHRKTQSLLTIPTGGERHRGRHHRHKSSIGQLMETVAEGVQTEATMVKHAFKRELEDADLGNRYFLDMNLTRSLSILPEDIQEFSVEAVGRQSISLLVPSIDQDEEEEQPPPTPVATLSSYLALLSAVLAVSSNGTALALLHDVHPAIKLFWRMTAVATVLSFFAIKTMIKQYQSEEKQFLPKLSWNHWVTFFLAAICFFFHTLLLFTALTMTSIGNAVIGANSQALLLVLGKLLTGQRVVMIEGLGVLIAFVGCILCSGDEASDDDNDGDGDKDVKFTAIIGDLLALGSAALGVCYLTFAKAIRSHISVTVFMFLVVLTGSVLCFLYICCAGISFSWGNDPRNGLFGWMTLEGQHVFIILYVAIVCNVVGTMGFVRAMAHFDNIIIAVATLLEPMIATLIAFVLGVGDLPGKLGWMGNFFVALGTLGVVYPSIHDNSGGGGH